MLNLVKSQGWNITGEVQVINPIPTVSTLFQGTLDSVRELVYVGPLNSLGGIKVFCDAIDTIAPELGKAGVTISFVGTIGTIDDFTSEEWIEIHASSWDEFGIKWSLHPVSTNQEIIDFLADPALGRLAISPSIADAVPTLNQELYFGGFPLLASQNSGVKDAMEPSHQDALLFVPEAAPLGQKLKSSLRYTGKLF